METSRSNHDVKEFLNAPIMTVGKYKGVSLDKVPNSYLRWMLSQEFPKELVEFAHKKVSESEYFNEHISLSRHSIDMFSKRFIAYWNSHVRVQGEAADGLATFIAKMALKAWNEGKAKPSKSRLKREPSELSN